MTKKAVKVTLLYIKVAIMKRPPADLSVLLPEFLLQQLAVLPVSRLHYTLHLLTVYTHKEIFYNKIAQSFPQFLLQQLAVLPISHVHDTLHLLTVHAHAHTHTEIYSTTR